MTDIWRNLKTVLSEEFLEVGDMTDLTSATTLGEIPNWDSMAAVNLQILINETFQVDLPLDLLQEEASFEDLMGFIRAPETIAVAMKKRSGEI